VAEQNDIVELVKQNFLHQLRAGLPDGADEEALPTPCPAAILKEALAFVKFQEQRGRGGEVDALKTAIDRQRKALRLTGSDRAKTA